MDPFRPIWRILTSVRIAVFVIATLAGFGLLGVLIPQVPEAMRGNDAAISVWLDTKRGTFGPFTDIMFRLGLFEVFRAKWFLIALGFLVVNVSTCVFNRWSPTFRNVFQPPRRVPDAFFESAHNRAKLAPVAPRAAEAALRRLRFKVRMQAEGDATYIFADRHPWAQLATFISHAALILFIAGGLVTRLTGFSTEIFTGEGTVQPVFAVSDPRQLQVRIDETTGRYGEKGNPLDFRTHLTIFRNGEEVASGVTTVNDPLKYGGYRFHQVGYFPDGAALRIRETATGNTVFHETFPLQDSVVAPTVTIRDAAGTVLLSDVIAPTDFGDAISGALVSVTGGGRSLWIGLTARDDETWHLVAFDPRPADEGERIELDEGTSGALGGLDVSFDRVAALPSALGVGLAPDGGEGQLLAQLTTAPDGGDALLLTREAAPALSLAEGQPAVLGGYEYTFEGRRAFSGIAVRRDRGAWFIWAATGMLVGGLAITFYVPRRRLWLKLTGDAMRIGALAEKSGGFARDMRILARRLGVGVPPELEEER